MPDERFSGQLHVPVTGFEWGDAGYVEVEPDVDTGEIAEYRPTRDRYLFVPDRVPFEVRSYELFTEHPGLFRTFANLRVTENEILSFANQFGWLGVPTTIANAENLPERDEDDDDYSWEHRAQKWWLQQIDKSVPYPFYEGESLTVWTASIRNMRNALQSWEKLKAGEPLGPNRARTRGGVRHGYVSDWKELIHMVNHFLRYKSAPQLKKSSAGAQLTFETSVLIESLWLQFANAIEGNKEFQRCKHCHSYFEIGAGAGRKGKAYCTDACKSAAWRSRKEQKT